MGIGVVTSLHAKCITRLICFPSHNDFVIGAKSLKILVNVTSFHGETRERAIFARNEAVDCRRNVISQNTHGVTSCFQNRETDSGSKLCLDRPMLDKKMGKDAVMRQHSYDRLVQVQPRSTSSSSFTRTGSSPLPVASLNLADHFMRHLMSLMGGRSRRMRDLSRCIYRRSNLLSTGIAAMANKTRSFKVGL